MPYKDPEKLREYKKKYRELNREKAIKYSKIYYLNNKESLSEKNKIYWSINKDRKKTYSREYYLKNKARSLEYAKSHAYNIRLRYKERSDEQRAKAKEKGKLYYIKNRERYNLYRRERYKNNELHNLMANVRILIIQSLKFKGFKKESKTKDILGCTTKDFRSYIESQFESWMTWENKGHKIGLPDKVNMAWDLDHKIPLSSAKTKDDIIRLSHYTNFQPLCSYANRYIKRNKITTL